LQQFRFRVARHRGGPAEWKRFGQELNLPLQATIIGSTDMPVEQSFLSVDAANVVVSAFKPSEADPEWSVIRLQEIGGVAGVVRVTAPFTIRDAHYASTVESRTRISADLNSIRVNPWQTITILARIERRGR
jgi:alpha-mannosidase